MNAQVTLRHLTKDTAKATGQVRYYVRMRGAPRKIRVPAPDHPDFGVAYANAVAALTAEKGGQDRPRGLKGSLDWLTGLYYASAEYEALSPITRERRRGYLDEFCADRAKPRPGEKVGAPFGTMPADAMSTKLLKGMRDRWQKGRPNDPNPKLRTGGKDAANNRLKAVKALYRWAVEAEHVKGNPARDVPLIVVKTSGFHTATRSEIAAFLRHHGEGSAPRRAMLTLLFTGVRAGDAVRLSRSMVKGARLRFVPSKTEKSSAVEVDIPFMPPLAAELGRSFPRVSHFVLGVHGRPFANARSFGTSFSRWSADAGVPHLSPHTIRKGGAAWLAEAGLTPSQLNAIYGWTGMRMAGLYTAKADRARQSEALEVLGSEFAALLNIGSSDGG